MNRCRSLPLHLALAVGLLASCLPGGSRAQDYPVKPVTFVVASIPGGILDTVGRLVARGLEKMGQPVVVQNVGGAGGTIGTAVVAKAAPDGYTLGMVATSHGINPSVYSKMPYDTLRDLVAISQAVNLTNLLVVHPSVPAKTLQEFIELARRRHGELNFGSAGNGQSNHLSGEMFKTIAGIQMNHIPYKGSAAAMTDVMSGQIAAMFVDVLSALPQVKAGRLRALAISSSTRLPGAPDIPTFAESGMANFNANSWLGVVGRAGTPPAIVAKLGEAVSAAMNEPETRQQLLAMGVQPVGSTPEQFASFLETEIQRYGAAVKAAGVKLD